MFQNDHDSLDIRSEQIRTRLVRIRNKLERKEHGGAEDVERTPVKMARHSEVIVREEVWAGLRDELGETICGADGCFK